MHSVSCLNMLFGIFTIGNGLLYLSVCLIFFFIFFMPWNQAPPIQPSAGKASNKSSMKAAEKKGKTVEVAVEQPLDPVAEKLRQQRWVFKFNFCLFWMLIITSGFENAPNKKLLYVELYFVVI